MTGYHESFRPGQIIIVKRGRDKGLKMVVLDVEKERDTIYLRLADGKTRPLSKPKRKKAMHVQPTNFFADLHSAEPGGLQDANIRKMLREEVSALGKI